VTPQANELSLILISVSWLLNSGAALRAAGKPQISTKARRPDLCAISIKTMRFNNTDYDEEFIILFRKN